MLQVNREQSGQSFNGIPELSEEEEAVVRILVREGDTHINILSVQSNIPVHRLSAMLFELEMKGVVRPLVGGMYRQLLRKSMK